MVAMVYENLALMNYVLMLILGACFGSFAALIIDRLPREMSIVRPRSRCHACKRPLKIWMNIPIVSWLILRGRCGFCSHFIGVRSLIIEVLFSLALLALYIKLGCSFALLERFALFFLLVCLAYIDLDTFLLPYGLLISLFLVGISSSIVYYLQPHLFVAMSAQPMFLDAMVFNETSIFSIFDRIAGAGIGLLLLLFINGIATMILRKSGRLTTQQWAMGFGDPLLLMAIGLFIGASHLVLLLFLSSMLGSFFGIVSQIFSKNEQIHDEIAKGALPYGPFLAIAGIYIYLL